MKTSKFNKGQKVNYLGHNATITSVKWNVFSEQYSYSVSYKTKVNRSARGIQENHNSIKAL